MTRLWTAVRLGEGILLLATLGGCVGGAHRSPAPVQPWRKNPATAAALARARDGLARSFPPAYRAVQRAILTVGHKQFALDAALRVTTNQVAHLALVSPLGLVSEVQVEGSGSAAVLKVTPLFKASWSRRYVARDLRWLFLPPEKLEPAGWLPDGRLALEMSGPEEGLVARYIVNAEDGRWEALQWIRNGRCVYAVSVVRHAEFPGWPRAVPVEFAVDAGVYELNIRIVELKMLTDMEAGSQGSL